MRILGQFSQPRLCLPFRRFCFASSFSTAAFGTDISEPNILSQLLNWLSGLHAPWLPQLVQLRVYFSFKDAPPVLAFAFHDLDHFTGELPLKPF